MNRCLHFSEVLALHAATFGSWKILAAIPHNTDFRTSSASLAFPCSGLGDDRLAGSVGCHTDVTCCRMILIEKWRLVAFS